MQFAVQRHVPAMVNTNWRGGLPSIAQHRSARSNESRANNPAISRRASFEMLEQAAQGLMADDLLQVGDARITVTGS